MKKSNSFFTVCGVLEILAAVAYAFIAVVCFVAYRNCMALGIQVEEGVEVDYTEIAPMFLYFAIFAVIVCAVAIFLAWLFLKHRKLSYQEMHQKSGLIVTGIVLSFLFGGIFIGVIALIGYTTPSSPYVQHATQENASTDLREKLENLQSLLDEGQITQEEYDQMRKDILAKF